MKVRIQEDELEVKKSATYKIPQTRANKHSHHEMLQVYRKH